MMVVFTFLAGFLKGGSGLSPFHCFLMTLMRMRLNLPLHLFTHIFHVSKPTVSRIFNSTLNVMYSRLSPLIVWPSKEQIQISLPMCFKTSSYRNCTSIIDCFEIFLEKPKNLRARAQTYSQYKHHNTVKYLISITPQGVISFVSTGWGGRTSDKHITQNSADRGFTIGDAVGLYSAHLKIPAFTKGKQQLHPSELETTRGLAAVRIHVERVIGLVRNKYTILQSTIPISLCQVTTPGELTSLDKMVTVCCALCNIFQNISLHLIHCKNSKSYQEYFNYF
uniref:DDE Tnp4 domain-containing protein n=1 Tax=Myripristis murdjan TaxID=586833 RepID=A0A667XA43_9TELE